MPLKKAEREEIIKFVINAVEKHPRDIVKVSAAHFNVTGQAIRNYLHALILDGVLISHGTKKGMRYELRPHEKQFPV